jgi:hypothetical protein
MSGHNGFLKEFLDIRRNMHKSEPTVKEKRDKMRNQKVAPTADNDMAIETTLARIIEEKPKKKEVEMFLQKECDKLTKEKMK